jgi:hypothetical protein
MMILLILLIILPIAALAWARRNKPKHKYLITLCVLGLIIMPLSLGLHSTYFLGPAGFFPGIVGLVSSMFHSAPGYELAVIAGLIPSGYLESGSPQMVVICINGVFWALVYGVIGNKIDNYRNRANAL